MFFTLATLKTLQGFVKRLWVNVENNSAGLETVPIYCFMRSLESWRCHGNVWGARAVVLLSAVKHLVGWLHSNIGLFPVCGENIFLEGGNLMWRVNSQLIEKLAHTHTHTRGKICQTLPWAVECSRYVKQTKFEVRFFRVLNRSFLILYEQLTVWLWFQRNI